MKATSLDWNSVAPKCEKLLLLTVLCLGSSFRCILGNGRIFCGRSVSPDLLLNLADLGPKDFRLGPRCYSQSAVLS